MEKRFGHDPVPACLVLAAALSSIVVTASSTQDEVGARVDWVMQAAHPFDTDEAGRGFDDLEPLREIVGDARIVSLGEATHGTREFFRMKHRITELLASEMGFTLFAIEANMPEAHRLNAWVLGDDDESDPRDLIAGMYFWTWNTEEVLDMVRWMREFNRAERQRGGPRRIGFTGFDMQIDTVAAEIAVEGAGALGEEWHDDLRQRYRKAQTFKPQGMGGPAEFAAAVGTFPAEAAAGRQIVFSGWVRTDDVDEGYAGLWWRADLSDRPGAAFDNMQARGPRGTTDWEHISVELAIPADTTNINFGVLHTGTGTAWFDGLSVAIDGEPYDPGGIFDFDFEEGPPFAGFVTRGQGWHFGADDEDFKTGTRSLRIRRVADATPAGITAAEAAELTLEALERLEARRSDLAAAAGERGAEWAIQNARIVSQRYQMFTNQVSRDESMATNVRWILDHAPEGTKIVLWAHNGHVHRMPGMMGSFLDEMYGDAHVAIGFTAASGTYTAFVAGQGVKSGNELAGPAKGSIEEVFRATSQPRLILDLRTARADEDAGWLNELRGFRTIGATALDGPQQFQRVPLARAYDALVYFERTEASRPIRRSPLE